MAGLIQIQEPGAEPVEDAGDRPAAVGIDLGTTNSVVAVGTEAGAEVIRDDNGEALVPSVVAYAADGSTVVGELARRLMLDRPDVVVGSIKRLMGRGIEDIKALAGVLPYDVEPPGERASGMVRLTVAGHRLTPVEVSAEILKALRDRAEQHLGGRVGQAVITVPAYFDDAARTATKDAARLAGLEVLRLVNEPTAAALAYGLDQGAEGLYAVYDLGGGTFDVSLLRMEKGVFQVLATGGDAALGGDDFDHAIAEAFLAERKQRLGEETLTTGEVKMALMSARLAKECLSTQTTGSWVIDAGDSQTSHTLSRDQLEALIEPFAAAHDPHLRGRAGGRPGFAAADQGRRPGRRLDPGAAGPAPRRRLLRQRAAWRTSTPTRSSRSARRCRRRRSPSVPRPCSSTSPP